VSLRFRRGTEGGGTLKGAFIDALSPARRALRAQKADFWALRGVDFTVRRGEVLGLIGPNGSGKSTLLKLVAGVLRPSEGRIALGGTVCPMIELGTGFDLALTARENIYLNGAILGYSRDYLEKRFDEIVAFSGLEAFLDAPLRGFSSGMTARLAFSIATVVEPEILIVDQILSVGDLAFQARSEARMLRLIGGGTTVLYVSHALNSIRRLCNRVLWLEGGRVRAIGAADTLCGEYERTTQESVMNNE
jgi:ABC-type polysaccharide/polyol phosphate transport system ATPase subunit